MQGRLVQGLGVWSATALVAGNIIGSGIYVIPASLADVAGPMSLLAWPIVTVGYLVLNAVYADLAEVYPVQGGLQSYAAAAFGRFAGGAVATLYWMSCVVGNAAFMTSFVGYATVFYPSLARPTAAFCLAQTLLWTLTLINVFGIKAGAMVQSVTTILKIAPLLILAVVLVPHAETRNLVPFAPKGWSALFPAIALVAWPFLGAESATIPAGEMKNARRTVRRAAFAGLGLAALVYFAIASAVALALPSTELAGSVSPMAIAARHALGPWGEDLVTAGALVAVAGVLNGWILIAGRLPQAAARDGYYPRFLERLSPKTGAPVVSLLVSGAATSAFAATYFSNSLLSAYNLVALAATAAALVAVAITCLALVALVRREPSRFRPAQRKRAPFFAAVGLGVVAILLGGSGGPAWAIASVVVLLPIPFFFRTQRGSA